MEKLIKKFGPAILLSLSLLLLLSLTAEAYRIPDYYRPENQPFGLKEEILGTGEHASGGATLILQIIAGGLLYFAAPVAVIMAAIAAIFMIVGGQDPDKLGKSKKALTWITIGLLVIMLSYSIIRIVLNILLEAASV